MKRGLTTVTALAGLALLLPAAASARLDAPGAEAARAGDALAAVPAAARAAVSAVLGRDTPAYHVEGRRARNAAHGLSVRFSGGGVAIDGPGGRVRLELRAFGYGEQLTPVAPAPPAASANRVEYRRGGGLTEWYVNGPAGLEQGFTLAAPPAGPAGGPLTLALTLGGDLEPSLAGEDTLALGSGLRYSGLLATDSRGRELPAWLELAAPSRLLIRVDDTGARYPLTIDPLVEAAVLLASDGSTDDSFGASVAASGDTIVVGSAGDAGDDTRDGSVYVFEKPAGGWAGILSESAKLVASSPVERGAIGARVAIDGDTVVTSAHGGQFCHIAFFCDPRAYVFVKPAGGWAGTLTETALLVPPPGGYAESFFVAIAGDTVVVTADGGAGAAWVYVRPPSGWSGTPAPSATLVASAPRVDQRLGWSAAVSGDAVFLGAVGPIYGDAAGAVYAYEEPAGGWSGTLTESATLLASDGVAGDGFGYSLAASGDTVLSGTPFPDWGGRMNLGVAYVFERPSGGWSGTVYESAKLVASDPSVSASFGSSVALGPEWAAVTAMGSQRIYAFLKPGGGWSGTLTETEQLAVSPGAGPYYCWNRNGVSLAGGAVVAGMPCWTVGGNTNQGAAHVFALCPRSATWAENGHRYRAVCQEGVSWEEASAAAQAAGGHLATLGSVEENEFVFGLVDFPGIWGAGGGGPWVGLVQEEGAVEPAGGWGWVTGEQLEFTAWAAGLPDDAGAGGESRGQLWSGSEGTRSSAWNDAADAEGGGLADGYVIEWEPVCEVPGGEGAAPGRAARVLAADSTAECALVVNVVSDEADDDLGDGRCDVDPDTEDDQCTLRAAIEEANAREGEDTVLFAIPGAGPHVIAPESALPGLEGPVLVNAASQPEGRVVVDGSELPQPADCLRLLGSEVTLRKLVVHSCPGAGVAMLGSGGHVLESSWIGLDADGATARANGVGVRVESAGNRIGGDGEAANVISGNGKKTPAELEAFIQGQMAAGGDPEAALATLNAALATLYRPGVYLGTGASGTDLVGNRIGLAASGPGLAGQLFGVVVSDFGAANAGTEIADNTFGGNLAGVFALGVGDGVSGLTVSGNTISGTGSSAVFGRGIGVMAAGAVPGLVLAGNQLEQLSMAALLVGAGVTGAQVTGGNAFSHDGTGVLALATRSTTISDNTFADGGGDVVLVGPRELARHVVSGNTLTGKVGVLLSGPDGVQITDNTITSELLGLLLAGTQADGVYGNTIQGSVVGISLISVSSSVFGEPGRGNTISGGGIGAFLLHGEPEERDLEDVDVTPGSLDASAVMGALGDLGTPLALANGLSPLDLDATLVYASRPSGAANTWHANTIQGNGVGMYILGAVADNWIGDVAPGRGNTITANGYAGILLGGTPAPVGITVRGNALFGNGGQNLPLYPGVRIPDLELIAEDPVFAVRSFGPTPNDPGDGDTGPNGLQNMPVLTRVSADGKTIEGVLDSTPGGSFHIDVYANDACQRSGYGGGQTYLGTKPVTTDGTGHAAFTLTLPAAVGATQVVTATATGAGYGLEGSTSELSRCAARGTQTTLRTAAAAGDTSLDVADSDGFLGSVVAINPGGDTEEQALVTGLGSLVLARPLRFAHAAGEEVVALPHTLYLSADRAHLHLDDRPHRDHAHLHGRLQAAAGGQLACGDQITLTLDDPAFTQILPGTALRPKANGRTCVYQRNGNQGGIKKLELDLRKGTFAIDLDKLDLAAPASPLTLTLQIGDNSGAEHLPMTRHGHTWRYKR